MFTSTTKLLLDLYNSVQIEQLIKKASEVLDISRSELSQIIIGLVTALEKLPWERLESMKPKKVEKKQRTEQERKAAIAYLEAPGLIGPDKPGHCSKRAGGRGNQQPDRLPHLNIKKTAHPCT